MKTFIKTLVYKIRLIRNSINNYVFIDTILNNFKLHSVLIRKKNHRTFYLNVHIFIVYILKYYIKFYNCVFMDRSIHIYVFIVRTVYSFDNIDYNYFNYVDYTVYQNLKLINTSI